MTVARHSTITQVETSRSSSSSASPARSRTELPPCSSTMRRQRRHPTRSCDSAWLRDWRDSPCGWPAMASTAWDMSFSSWPCGEVPFVLVEPLLVLSLVVALPVAARREHQRISLPALAAAGAIAAGLGLFLGVARPGIGHPHVTAETWIIVSAIVATVCADNGRSAEPHDVAESSRRPACDRVRRGIRLCGGTHREHGSSAQSRGCSMF